MRTTFIYALKEPDTGEIRYIGTSDDPQKRWGQHYRTKEKCHRGNWIRALKKEGLTPVLEIVDEIPHEFRDQLERAYITFFREQGYNLTNQTPGGEGAGSGSEHPCFGKRLTAGHKTKISVASVGHVKSPEHRAKLSAANSGENNPKFGKKLPEEMRAKISVALTGRVRSPEHCANISAAKTGVKHSPEYCAKNSAAQMGNQNARGHVCSPEHRASVSAAQKGNTNRRGCTLLPETKALISTAKKMYWEKKRQEKILAEMWS